MKPLIFTLTAVLLMSPAALYGAERKPNVVLILIDDFG